MAQIRNLRWWIAILLSAGCALSYLDRQNFPIAVVEIQKSIPITTRQYSLLISGFLLSYALMYVIGGRVIDRLGTKIGYGLMIGWWSLATFGNGLATTIVQLGIARFGLGLGEGGGFPASAKAVSEWFPPEERSFAFGIFNTGSSLGAMIAPPLIAFVIVHSNWRWAFYTTGLLGVFWLFAWMRLYNRPEVHNLLTDEERAHLSRLCLRSGAAFTQTVVPWTVLFRYRQTWGLLLATFISNPAWYFFIFWLPKYLADARHLDIAQIGYFAWIPYACAAAGSLVGGWFSSFLIVQGFQLDHSRKIALALSAGMMPASLLVVGSPLSAAIVFFSLAFLGFQFWSTILQTVTADIFPSSTVASVIGINGAVGSLGGVLFNVFVGWYLTSHSYSGVMTIAGLLLPSSFVILFLLVKKVEPLNHQTALPEVERRSA